MRSYLPAYDMVTPRDLARRSERRRGAGTAGNHFAGGTDLMVLLEAGKLAHRKFLSIWKLGELRGKSVSPEHVTHRRADDLHGYTPSRALAREFPLLARAAAETGGDRHAESRHARRKHRERVARRGFPAGAAGVRGAARACLRPRRALRPLHAIPHAATNRWIFAATN